MTEGFTHHTGNNQHFGNLNLANYQKANKDKSQVPMTTKVFQKRTNSINLIGNSKILEKNEGMETHSVSSYEESISKSQKDLQNLVSYIQR